MKSLPKKIVLQPGRSSKALASGDLDNWRASFLSK